MSSTHINNLIIIIFLVIVVLHLVFPCNKIENFISTAKPTGAKATIYSGPINGTISQKGTIYGGDQNNTSPLNCIQSHHNLCNPNQWEQLSNKCNLSEWTPSININSPSDKQAFCCLQKNANMCNPQNWKQLHKKCNFNQWKTVYQLVNPHSNNHAYNVNYFCKNYAGSQPNSMIYSPTIIDESLNTNITSTLLPKGPTVGQKTAQPNSI